MTDKRHMFKISVIHICLFIYTQVKIICISRSQVAILKGQSVVTVKKRKGNSYTLAVYLHLAGDCTSDLPCENLFVCIYWFFTLLYILYFKNIFIWKLNIQNTQNIALKLAKVYFYFLPKKLGLPTEESLIFLDNKTTLIMFLYFLTENRCVVS